MRHAKMFIMPKLYFGDMVYKFCLGNNYNFKIIHFTLIRLLSLYDYNCAVGYIRSVFLCGSNT